MSSSSNTKKRRVGGDMPAAETDNSNNELIAIKSSIDELVHQNRTQNENITNLLQVMKGMQDEMRDMRGEITQLRQKCDSLSMTSYHMHFNQGSVNTVMTNINGTNHNHNHNMSPTTQATATTTTTTTAASSSMNSNTPRAVSGSDADGRPSDDNESALQINAINDEQN